MKAICVLALAALTASLSLPAAAQFAKKDDAIDYRQSALSVMAAHFARLGAMAKGDVPFDAKAAQENADIVVFMSRLPWAGFGPDTEGGKAKPNVWTENAKFKELAGKMEAEAVKLAAAAKQNDLASLKAAFGATAGSCKACHDSFRSR